MKCKKCGNNMPDGARYCISCGAEHDTNGQLVIKNNQVDYNKTIMINDISSDQGSSYKVDYNKTMMANDVPSSNKVDYNKTMMANDIPISNNKIDYNKTMMADDLPVNNKNIHGKVQEVSKTNVKEKKKKKFSPITLIIFLLLILAVGYKLIILDNKKNVTKPTSNVVVDVIQETTAVGNVVSDFNASNGYWSNDAEYFYRNGTVQKNQWIGDYYVGDNGRKVRNMLIDDTYYVDATGKKVKNQWYKFTRNISGENVTIWYYLGTDGAKLRDTLTPDGYYVDVNGMYIPGEYDSPNSKVYIPNKQ